MENTVKKAWTPTRLVGMLSYILVTTPHESVLSLESAYCEYPPLVASLDRTWMVYSEGAVLTGSSMEMEPVPSFAVVTAFSLKNLAMSAVCQHCLFFLIVSTNFLQGRSTILALVKQSLMSTVSPAGKPL